jgi:Zn ribbon nucleic-acid-binding protein
MLPAWCGGCSGCDQVELGSRVEAGLKVRQCVLCGHADKLLLLVA